jgi:hypothetical protein
MSDIVYDKSKKSGKKVVKLFDPLPDLRKHIRGPLMPNTKPKPTPAVVEAAIAERDNISAFRRHEIKEETNYLIKDLHQKADKELMKYFEQEIAFNLKKQELEGKRDSCISEMTYGFNAKLDKVRKGPKYQSALKSINKVTLKKLNNLKEKIVSDIRKKYGNAVAKLILSDMQEQFKLMWNFPSIYNRRLHKELDKFDLLFKQLELSKRESRIPSISCPDLVYTIEF